MDGDTSRSQSPIAANPAAGNAESASPEAPKGMQVKRSIPRQVFAMSQKRVRYTLRDPIMLLCQVFCPGITCIALMGVIQSFLTSEPRVLLSFDVSGINNAAA